MAHQDQDAPSHELVIFDCDGVLVDSEPTVNAVFAAMLAEWGLVIDDEAMSAHFVGRTSAECERIAAGMLGHPLPADFSEDCRRRTLQALRAGVRAMPGVAAVLDGLRLPYCVASNGEHDKMRLTLGSAGLLPRFEGRLFSADDVSRGKPAPDLFLHAARHCGVAPSACAVIEDTPTGVAAAVAAGMTAYGYAASTPAPVLLDAGAHRVFDDMRRLPAMLHRASAATRDRG